MECNRQYVSIGNLVDWLGALLKFLGLNYNKFDALLAKHGPEKFGGDFESYRFC